jgi:hypothetical protein
MRSPRLRPSPQEARRKPKSKRVANPHNEKSFSQPALEKGQPSWRAHGISIDGYKSIKRLAMLSFVSWGCLADGSRDSPSRPQPSKTDFFFLKKFPPRDLMTTVKSRGHYVGIHVSNFKDFLLKPELLRAVTDCGFEHPSEGIISTSDPFFFSPRARRGSARRRQTFVRHRICCVMFNTS